MKIKNELLPFSPEEEEVARELLARNGSGKAYLLHLAFKRGDGKLSDEEIMNKAKILNRVLGKMRQIYEADMKT